MESVVDIYFRGDLFKTVGISQNASLDKLRKAANLHSWAAFIQNGQQIPSFLEIEPVTEQGKKENKKVYYVSDIIQDGKVYTEIRQAMFETSPPFLYVYSRMRENVKWFFTPNPDRLAEIEKEEKARIEKELAEAEMENEVKITSQEKKEEKKFTPEELFEKEENERKEWENTNADEIPFPRIYNEKKLSEIRDRYAISNALRFTDKNDIPIDLEKEEQLFIKDAVHIVEFFPGISGLALVNIVAPEYAELPFKIYKNQELVKEVKPTHYDQTLKDFRAMFEIPNGDKFLNKYGEPCTYEEENRVFDVTFITDNEQQIHLIPEKKNDCY